MAAMPEADPSRPHMAVDDALRSFGIQQRPRSNALWAAFDNTEGRLRGRERHIVGHNRLGKAFQGDRANLFSCDASFERDVDALAEQDLTVPGLTAEPSRNIAHGADRGIAGSFGEADLTQRRITLRNPGAKAQIPTARAPGLGHGRGSLKNTMMPSPENWSSVPSNWATSGPSAP